MARPKRVELPDSRTLCPEPKGCGEWKFYHEFSHWTDKNGQEHRQAYCKACKKKMNAPSEQEKVLRSWAQADKLFEADDELFAYVRNRMSDVVDIYEGVMKCLESSGSTQVELPGGQRIRLSAYQTRAAKDSGTDTSTVTKNGPADS